MWKKNLHIFVKVRFFVCILHIIHLEITLFQFMLNIKTT